MLILKYKAEVQVCVCVYARMHMCTRVYVCMHTHVRMHVFFSSYQP